jgi:large subunit ribosomal protein L31e
MADEKLERIYTVPLGKAYDYTRTKRTPRAVKLLKEFISRHMKADLGNVLLSNSLNNHIWGRSIQKPPRRVKIRVIKSDGKVRAYLPEEPTEAEKKPGKEEKVESAKAPGAAAKPREVAEPAKPKEAEKKEPAKSTKPEQKVKEPAKAKELKSEKEKEKQEKK